MFRTRFLCLLLALCCVPALAGPAAAAETDCDSIYCFSPEDFSEDPALLGICITQLPDSAAGTLLLDHRVLMAGDILTAEQVARMTFTLSGRRRTALPRWVICPFLRIMWRLPRP